MESVGSKEALLKLRTDQIRRLCEIVLALLMILDLTNVNVT